LSRLKCPQCEKIFTPADPRKPVCTHCGYSAAGPAPSTQAPAAYAQPSFAPSGSWPSGPAPSPYPNPQVNLMAPPATSGLAVTAMIIGIVALCLNLASFGFVWAVAYFAGVGYMFLFLLPPGAALGLGMGGIASINKNKLGGRGMAISGVVLGSIGVAIVIVQFILYISFGADLT
jgi:hypothetical protein